MRLKAKLKFAKRLVKELDTNSAAFMAVNEIRRPILSTRYLHFDDDMIAIPNAAYMKVTNYCESACKGCYVSGRDNEAVIKREIVDSVFRDGSELGFTYYTFLGGEPFSDVSRDIVMGSIKDHPKQRIVACTNAWNLDEQSIAELAQYNNFSVLYSIDGFREYNDYKRGSGSFDQTIDVMNIAKEKMMISGAMSTIDDDNYLEISSKDFIEFLIGKGMMYVAYSPIIGSVLSPPGPEQYAKFIDRINHLSWEYPILIHSNNFGRLSGAKELDLESQGLRAINIEMDGTVTTERFTGECGKMEPSGYSLKAIIEDPGFQEIFKEKFHGDNFEEISLLDKRYGIFGDSIACLEEKGYVINRPE